MEVTSITSQTIPVITPKTIVQPTGTTQPVNDTGYISSLSRSLNESNIDLSRSTFSYEAENINFKLKSLHNAEGESEIDGYISESMQSGKFKFKYEFSKTNLVNGKEVVKNYEAEFNLSFKNHSSVSVSNSEKKGDVLDFLHRIINGIFSKLNDPNTKITEIALEPQDLIDLAQVSDKKLIQLVYRTMEMVKWAMKAKKPASHDKRIEEVLYHPLKDKAVVKKVESTQSTSFDYSLTIKETDSSKTSH